MITYASLRIGTVFCILMAFFFSFSLILSFWPYILHIYISSTILLISKSKLLRKKVPRRLCCYLLSFCNWITIMDTADSAFSHTLALMAKAYFIAFGPGVWPPPKGYFSSAHFISSCSLETIVFTGFPCCSRPSTERPGCTFILVNKGSSGNVS